MTAGQHPEGAMLTIGQLADYVGVTVRAIRHYHQRGLLPEPGRDASGYRRYGAQAVTDLIRIKTLSDAGVPLARIAELLEAEPGQFARAVTDIDQALAIRIHDLEEQRHRIAELAAGDRLFLSRGRSSLSYSSTFIYPRRNLPANFWSGCRCFRHR